MTQETSRELVNVFLDDDKRAVVVRERVDGKTVTRRVKAEYGTWHKAEDLSPGQRQQLASPRFPDVKAVRESKDGWVKVLWVDSYAREHGRRALKENGVTSYEGDVDPVLAFLVACNLPRAKLRRCYLDIETDSRVELTRKEEMRVLSWALVDHETGEEIVRGLRADTDAAERELMRALAEAMRAYDQVCVWEGDWREGQFDSVVVPARWRHLGIDADERDWIWTNQLAVWRRHSSSETGEEASMKLDVIAHEQVGQGKEVVPKFVIERFGADACRRGLGRLAWQLWEAGGKFRELLLEYNARDSRLLRMLEKKKGFLTLAHALATLCGLHAEDRSMDPTRLFDGYMLRLARKIGLRFATRERFDKDEMPEKFKGAVVFPPKSVPNEKPKDGEPAWTRDQAAAWRREHGFTNGILHDVHVCDFSGMYPSIMMTWNLGPEVVAGWAKDPSELGPDQCMSPGTGLVTRTDSAAFIVSAFEEMAAQRKYWADLAATLPPGTEAWIDAMAMSTAYKVAMNAFYGAGGSPFSRFYNRDVAEATTQNAVHLLKLAAGEAEKRRMVIAYGDTDSNMLIGPSIPGFEKYVKWLNEVRFPEETKKYGCKKSKVKLAFEKSYDRIVMVSKKRYVARYLHYKFSTTCNLCTTPSGNPGSVDIRTLTCRDCKHVYDRIPKFLGKPEIKGVAVKRGEIMPIARELQLKVIDYLVGGVKSKDDEGKDQPVNPGMETPTEEIASYRKLIERYRDRVLAEPIELHLITESKGLSKPLRDYPKDASEVHVRVARMMVDRGVRVARGMKIEYIVVDGSVSPQRAVPVEDFTGEFDRYYVWRKAWSPSKQLLEAAFPDEDWDQWDADKPKARGGKRGKPVLKGQLGLGILGMSAKPEQKLDVADEVAVPAYRSSDLRVVVPELAGAKGIDRVKEVLEKHPGARSVVIVIQLRSGSEAVIQTPLRVSPGPKLRIEIDKAIASSMPKEVVASAP